MTGTFVPAPSKPTSSRPFSCSVTPAGVAGNVAPISSLNIGTAAVPSVPLGMATQ